MKEITNSLMFYNRKYVIKELSKKAEYLSNRAYLASPYSKSNFRFQVHMATATALLEIRETLIQQEYLAFIRTLNKV